MRGFENKGGCRGEYLRYLGIFFFVIVLLTNRKDYEHFINVRIFK
jgi:hypothetical protein